MIDSGREIILIYHLLAAKNELACILPRRAGRNRIERQVFLNRRINRDGQRCAGTWIVNIARTCSGRWNGVEIRDPLGLPYTLIVEKEESPVWNDRAANCAAKLIALESRFGGARGFEVIPRV